MAFNLKEVILKLEINEVQRLLSIDLEEDQEEALRFIRETLAKRVKEALKNK